MRRNYDKDGFCKRCFHPVCERCGVCDMCGSGTDASEEAKRTYREWHKADMKLKAANEKIKELKKQISESKS